MYKTQINITYLDGLTDQLLTNERPKRIGVNVIDLVTDNFYRRVDDPVYKQQPVQSITQDKYEIQLIVTEDYSVELLKYAKKVTVTAFNGDMIHDALILNVSREKAADTDFSLITIEYADTRLGNYKYALPPVHNYLRSDAIAEQFPISQRTFLRVNYGTSDFKDFNTMLIFVPTAKQPENNNFTNTQSGITVTTNSIIKKQIEGVFYLNAEDIQLFQTMLPLADNHSIRAHFYVGGISYKIDEVPEISVEMLAGWDIFKCSVSFVYETINYYSYAGSQSGGGGTT